MTKLRTRLAGALLALALTTPALAQEAGPGRRPPDGQRPPAEAGQRPSGGGLLGLLPPPSTTRHTLALPDRPLDYTATAGTLPLRDGKGQTTAEIFSVAYTAEPASPERPVTFVFNGGPGAASAFLNLGGLGPRSVALSETGTFLPPPSRVVDNPDTWLAFTDLVFVDPVGTGYSRAADDSEDGERRFWGVNQDASAMAAFVRLWLARAGRMTSPVFLAGESYGGFRAALLTRVLPEESGIAPSGAVLISPALEFALIHPEEYDLLPWALYLPSMAAVNLERHGVKGPEFDARLAEAERFAMSDYLVALAHGPGGLPPGLQDRLVSLTGLPPEVVAQSHGRVSPSRFVKEYLRPQGRVLSRYDGLLDGPDPDPRSPEPRGPDAVLDRSVPVWTTAFVDYVRGELGYQTDITYRLLNHDIAGKWDYGSTPSRQGFAGVLDDLQTGRTINPTLQVLIVGGHVDLVTPYLASRYLVDQLPALAGAAPITVRAYPGGHMVYMRPESRRMLAGDARALYGRALAAGG